MINFIDKNPTTEAINANETRDLREAQVANSLLTARDQRRATAAKDRIGRGIASIFADAAPTSAVPSSGEITTPIGAGTAQVMSAQPPQGDGMLAPATPTAQTYSVEQPKPVSALATVAPNPAADAMPKQSALTSFSAGRQSDPYRRAVQYAAGQEGGGELALQLASKQAEREQKRADLAHAEAIKAFGQGDFELAKTLNQRHGLGLDSVFGNPSALQASRLLAKSIEHLKLEPAQTIAYMDAAAQKFSETRDMNQAGMAGIAAARGVRPRGDKYLESSTGYVDPSTGKHLLDERGTVVMPPDRRLHFDPNSGGLTQAQERSNFEIDAAREVVAGMDPAEIRRLTAKATSTGRENKDYRPDLARAAALAGRRKIGDDQWFDSRSKGSALPGAAQQDSDPLGLRSNRVRFDAQGNRVPVASAPRADVADLANRFATDPTMKNMRLGALKPEGREVLDASGKLIGHYR